MTTQNTIGTIGGTTYRFESIPPLPPTVAQCPYRMTVRGSFAPKIGTAITVPTKDGRELPLAIVVVEQVDAETYRLGCRFNGA